MQGVNLIQDKTTGKIMSDQYFFTDNINQLITEIPADTIVSRTFHTREGLKAIIFGFATGQELSEHTASVPALIHILSGEAQVTLGPDHFDAGPGYWASMPPKLAHSILARTPVTMLLLMLK
jgi:quercetin dioxygenase-like cupin family protein